MWRIACGVVVPLPSGGKVGTSAWDTAKNEALDQFLYLFGKPYLIGPAPLSTRLAAAISAASCRIADNPTTRRVGGSFAWRYGGLHFTSDGDALNGPRPESWALEDEMLQLTVDEKDRLQKFVGLSVLMDLQSERVERIRLSIINTNTLAQLIMANHPDFLLSVQVQARGLACCSDALRWFVVHYGSERLGGKSIIAKLAALFLPASLTALLTNHAEVNVFGRGTGGSGKGGDTTAKYSRAVFVFLDEVRQRGLNMDVLKAQLQRSEVAEYYPGVKRPLWSRSFLRFVTITTNQNNPLSLFVKQPGKADAQRVLTVGPVGPADSSQKALDTFLTNSQRLYDFCQLPEARLAALGLFIELARRPLPRIGTDEHASWPTLEKLFLAAPAGAEAVEDAERTDVDRLIDHVEAAGYRYTRDLPETEWVCIHELFELAGVAAKGNKSSYLFSSAKEALVDHYGNDEVFASAANRRRTNGSRSKQWYRLAVAGAAGAAGAAVTDWAAASGAAAVGAFLEINREYVRCRVPSRERTVHAVLVKAKTLFDGLTAAQRAAYGARAFDPLVQVDKLREEEESDDE